MVATLKLVEKLKQKIIRAMCFYNFQNNFLIILSESNPPRRKNMDAITEYNKKYEFFKDITGEAMRIHRKWHSGLLESAYEAALKYLLELDGYKRQVADEQRANAELRSHLTQARFDASQSQQNQLTSQGFANEVDALYNRLNNCPVPTTPVYGRTPIFTCQNNGCGCNCGGM